MALFGFPFDKYDRALPTISTEFSYQLKDKSIKLIRFSKEKYDNCAYWTAFYKNNKPILRVWGGNGYKTFYMVDFFLEDYATTVSGKVHTWDNIHVATDLYIPNTEDSKGSKGSPPPWQVAQTRKNVATNYENIAFAKTAWLNKFDRYHFVLLTDEERKEWL